MSKGIKKVFESDFEIYTKIRPKFHKPTRAHKKKVTYNRKDRSWKNIENW